VLTRHPGRDSSACGVGVYTLRPYHPDRCRGSIDGVSGVLHVVGTPIGNLADLSDRARETLANADVVAAEDTRRTGRLLRHLGITARMVSLFDANEPQRTELLIGQLRRGTNVALVSDAGMPIVSDPGFRLVRRCADEGIEVRVVPGPSAVTAALVVSGLPANRFVFEGFLPRKAGERLERLRALANEPRTVVLFESPIRLAAMLRDLLAELGDRRIAVARELTKLHEDVVRGTVSELLVALEGTTTRGEVVVVVEGATEPEATELAALVREAQLLVESGTRRREAARSVARDRGGSANEIYEALLRSKADGPD
jgi:16S rRNA (cytidine1402-2'-O)-methyltransferase